MAGHERDGTRRTRSIYHAFDPYKPEIRDIRLHIDKKNPAEYVDHEIERAFQLLASAWDKSSTGTIKATLKNAQLAIARLDLHCTHDRFKNRMYVQGHAVQQFNGEMTDNVAARIRDLILQKFGFDPGKDHTRDALHQLALANTFNSMTDNFDRLSWDGTPRLHQMLIDYFGAEAGIKFCRRQRSARKRSKM